MITDVYYRESFEEALARVERGEKRERIISEAYAERLIADGEATVCEDCPRRGHKLINIRGAGFFYFKTLKAFNKRYLLWCEERGADPYGERPSIFDKDGFFVWEMQQQRVFARERGAQYRNDFEFYDWLKANGEEFEAWWEAKTAHINQ